MWITFGNPGLKSHYRALYQVDVLGERTFLILHVRTTVKCSFLMLLLRWCLSSCINWLDLLLLGLRRLPGRKQALCRFSSFLCLDGNKIMSLYINNRGWQRKQWSAVWPRGWKFQLSVLSKTLCNTLSSIWFKRCWVVILVATRCGNHCKFQPLGYAIRTHKPHWETQNN